jgi:citrate lyase subunit beta/citryl-CoA lyase
VIGKTALFVPASSPKMLNAALAFPADSLIFDLEDAVSVGEKDAARDLLKEYLSFVPFKKQKLIIRINALDSEFWQDDFELAAASRADNIMIPKARVSHINTLSDLLDKRNSPIGLIPIIEMAISVEEVSEIIKASNRVCGVMFGAEDYTSDLGTRRTKEGVEVLFARSRVVNAAHAYGIEALDTPFVDFSDEEGLKKDTEFGKLLGYTGKTAIHPSQVDVINMIYAPTKEEIDYAQRIISQTREAEKLGKGAFSMEGKMVDAPIIKRAQTLLRRAGIEVMAND